MTSIYSPARSYTALARLGGNKRRLVARGGSDDSLYLLVMVDYPAFTRQLTPFFAQCHENSAFTDFIEFFPCGDGICAVFNHRKTRHMRPLGEALTDAPPAMRAAALRSLFAYLLLQDPPYPVLCDLLCSENLLCSASGEIGFTYDLHLTVNYASRSREAAMMHLAETVRTICCDVPVLSIGAFCGQITGQAEAGWDELYEAALSVSDELAAYKPEAQPERPNLRGHAEGFLAALTDRVSVLLAVTALAAGYILLAVLFYQAVISPQPVENGITSIGTVMLDDENRLS
jgi:hypothetical protein